MELLQSLFDTDDFAPRWTCGLWTKLHGYTHIIADLLIWGAYTAIPLVLAYFISRRRDLPLPNVFWLFCAFIFACGTTHLIEATLFYWPVYRVSAIGKVFTAVVSWATVMALIPATPKALALPGLAKINAELQQEMATRQQAQAELAETARRLEAKNEDLTEFLSITTHDLKHPIFSVRTLQSMLKSQHYERLDAKGREYIDLTLAECDRMTEMLAQLAALGRIDRTELEYETHDLAEFLDRCAQRFQGALSNRKYRVEIHAPHRTITFPRQQIEQALNNLLDNAIKYGGCDKDRPIELHAEVRQHEAFITVADHGPGVDPRHHQRIFQMFHRMAPDEMSGSGVGLAAVRRLLQRVGGSVTLESQVGQGARFRLRFPIK